MNRFEAEEHEDEMLSPARHTEKNPEQQTGLVFLPDHPLEGRNPRSTPPPFEELDFLGLKQPSMDCVIRIQRLEWTSGDDALPE